MVYFYFTRYRLRSHTNDAEISFSIQRFFSSDEINQRNRRRVMFQLSEESVMQIELSITAATKRHDEFKTNIRAMKTKRREGAT